jgi:hypothetical protein
MSSLGWTSAAGPLIQMFGLWESGKAAKAAGEAAKARQEFMAREAEREGGLAIAIGQRQAMEERRQSDLLASRALAVAASSGAGVSDPTIVDVISKTRGEGAYRASIALYEGEAKARRLRMEAAGARLAGADAVTAGLNTQFQSNLAAGGQLFRGGAKVYSRSLYDKYGMNGPSGDSALID